MYGYLFTFDTYWLIHCHRLVMVLQHCLFVNVTKCVTPRRCIATHLTAQISEVTIFAIYIQYERRLGN